jgi:hypothetical protein
MKFTMARDRSVSTKFGRSFEFKKGVPLHVPDMCWEDVQAAGAVPEDDLPVPEEGAVVVPQGKARTDAIQTAMKQMVLRGERNDFSASGAPKVEPLSHALGFPVDAKERDSVWVAVQSGEAA